MKGTRVPQVLIFDGKVIFLDHPRIFHLGANWQLSPPPLVNVPPAVSPVVKMLTVQTESQVGLPHMFTGEEILSDLSLVSEVPDGKTLEERFLPPNFPPEEGETYGLMVEGMWIPISLMVARQGKIISPEAVLKIWGLIFSAQFGREGGQFSRYRKDSFIVAARLMTDYRPQLFTPRAIEVLNAANLPHA